MKCFSFSLVFCLIAITIRRGCCQQGHVNSLSAISLLGTQVDFFETMCFNRTGDAAVYEELSRTIQECERVIMNSTGTELALTYSTLVNADPREFYEVFQSQCNDPHLRNECNSKSVGLLKRCLNESETESFRKIEDIFVKLDAMICEMDQQKMKNFFSLRGQECLTDNVITIFYCFMSLIPDDEVDRQNFLFNLIEGKECKVIDDIQACMMGELKLCEEKSVPHLFKLFFEFFKHELNCTIDDPLREEQHEALNSGSRLTTSGSQTTILFLLLLSKRFYGNFY